MWQDEWYTNTGLMFNVAVRNHYKKFNTKKLDMDWVLEEMSNHNELIWEN
jgi:hypothetical protein